MAIEVRLVDPAQTSLRGQFSLVAGAGASADEQRYAAKIGDMFKRLGLDEAFDAARESKAPSARSSAGRARREALIAAARDLADRAAQGGLAILDAENRTAVEFGRYMEARAQIEGRIFDVVKLGRGPDRELSEVRVSVRDTADPQAPQPGEAEQKLFVAIGETASVLAAARAQLLNVWWGKSAAASGADHLHEEFVDKLVGVAEVGLQGGRVAFASVALDNLRGEFVRRVAPKVKNRYMRKLGAWCAVFAALNLLLFAAATNGWPPFLAGAKACVGDMTAQCLLSPVTFTAQQLVERRMFFLLGAGACCGAWLSFAARNVEMTFVQLATPETDLLWPAFRVTFVMGLAFVLGLMIWSGVVTLQVGSISTALMRANGSVALLVGAFCGLAERSLAVALQGGAETLAGGVKTKS